MKKIENWEAETEVMVERATGFFRQGYNCSQSVAMAFAAGTLSSLCIKIVVTAGIYLGTLWLLKAAILRESLEYLLHKKK